MKYLKPQYLQRVYSKMSKKYFENFTHEPIVFAQYFDRST